MCPNNFLMLIGVGFALLLLAYSYNRQIQNAHSNGATVEAFLQTAVLRSKFFGINFDLEGYYRDRRVVYRYRMSSERSHSSDDIYIEPKITLPKQCWFLVDYPRPTPHTRLMKGRIFYDNRTFFRGGFFNLGNLVLLTSEEVRDILEELTQAASLVESGQQNA